MKVLVACEESQTVCIAFRERGHEAYSCDIIPCSGNHPEWHIQDDVLKHLDDGWDMMIAHPPCTHLANAGGRWFPEKRKDGRQQQGIDFFMRMINAPIKKICVENPVGIMSTIFKKPDQAIQPFYFGDAKRKCTHLWLKNLPRLIWISDDDLFNKKTLVQMEMPIKTIIRKGKYRTGTERKLYWYDSLSGKNAAKIKSKTFPGIAKAMAAQWG